MKKFSKKSVVVFAGVMAVCALAFPSMASALNWAPVGGADHQLTSTSFSFITEPLISVGASCAHLSLTGVVDSTSDMTITATSFTNCMGIGQAQPCTATPVGRGFPWTATATSPVVIHRISVTVNLENTPGAASACPAPVTVTLTGPLGVGVFNNVEHGTSMLPPATGTGLSGHPGNLSVTVSGTIRDDRQTLTLS